MEVYLLDDHELFSKSLEIAFSKKNVDIYGFTEPSAFLNKIEIKKPDLVLLDIHIGNKSGFDVYCEIVKKNQNQKIAFLSGYDLVEYKNKAIKLGAWGFLNKNSSIEQLNQDLEKINKGINLLSNEGYNKLISEREKNILQYVARGLKQREIADNLGISRRTVNNHLLSINDKLQVHSTVSAVLKAVNLGIIRIDEY